MAAFFLGALVLPLWDADEAREEERRRAEECEFWESMANEIEAEERELEERARREEGQQRARIEAVIRRIAQSSRRVFQRAAGCRTPPSRDLPEEVRVSWAQGSVDTQICVHVTGRRGQRGDVTIDQPSQPAPVQAFTIDETGRATVTFRTASRGPTRIFSRHEQQDGSFTPREVSVNTAEQSPPAPPGFEACPAPG